MFIEKLIIVLFGCFVSWQILYLSEQIAKVKNAFNSEFKDMLKRKYGDNPHLIKKLFYKLADRYFNCLKFADYLIFLILAVILLYVCDILPLQEIITLNGRFEIYIVRELVIYIIIGMILVRIILFITKRECDIVSKWKMLRFKSISYYFELF